MISAQQLLETQEEYNTKEKRVKFKELDIGNMNLEGHLNLKDFTELEKLIAFNNEITSVDLLNNKKLKHIDLSANPLKELDTFNNPKLVMIDIPNCEIERLDLSKNTKLEKLFCPNNKLKELDLKNNPKLAYFNLSLNKFTELDFSGNPEIIYANLANNKLKSVNLKNSQKLNKLFLTNNKVEGELDFSNNPELTTLFCPRNNISSFNFSKNKNLSKLICSGNKNLNFLDLSNTKIQEEGFKKQFSDESWGTPTVSTDLAKDKIKFSNLENKQKRESKIAQLKSEIQQLERITNLTAEQKREIVDKKQELAKLEPQQEINPSLTKYWAWIIGEGVVIAMQVIFITYLLIKDRKKSVNAK